MVIQPHLQHTAFVKLQNYNHRLVCHDLKGAWSLTNRRIAFGLFEAYTNAQVSCYYTVYYHHVI